MSLDPMKAAHRAADGLPELQLGVRLCQRPKRAQAPVLRQRGRAGRRCAGAPHRRGGGCRGDQLRQRAQEARARGRFCAIRLLRRPARMALPRIASRAWLTGDNMPDRKNKFTLAAAAAGGPIQPTHAAQMCAPMRPMAAEAVCKQCVATTPAEHR